MRKKVYYVLDHKLLDISRNISLIINRAHVVHSLISSYGLLLKCKVIQGEPATDEDLLSFHCSDYLEYLKKAQNSPNLEILSNTNDADDFNLGYDCPLFENIYDYVQLISGSSLSAAKRLVSEVQNYNDSNSRPLEIGVIRPRSYLKFSAINFNKDKGKCDVFELPENFSIDEDIGLCLKPIEQENYSCKVNNRKVVMVNDSLKKNENSGEKFQHISINWFGGWHHAQRDAAEGFCYVNDIVIAIQFLLKSFRRILYIDLDIHHGNGVENAFLFSPRVLVMNLHKYETGFYPSSGSVNDIGLGNGRYYTVNVPFKDGVTDVVYVKVFTEIFEKVFNKFKPECVVVQCGADSVAGDPLGGFNLTPIGLGQCLKLIIQKELPTLVLGGGGYNIPNTAKCWTYLTSIILDCPLSNDIPDNTYFHLFGPEFELAVTPTLRRNENSQDYVQQIIEKVLLNLNFLPDII